jgi:hypothetical protein
MMTLPTVGQRAADNSVLLLTSDSAKGTYGYRDEAGKIVIPTGKYPFCFTDTFRNYAIVLDSGNRIVGINRQERVLYSLFIFDNGPDDQSDGLFRIRKDHKIGYADAATGKIVISPRFACAWPFENGKARVALDCQTRSDGEHSTWISKHWFYINKVGKLLTE